MVQHQGNPPSAALAQYTRARPKQIHSPVEPMMQAQPRNMQFGAASATDFGDQFNNPDPQTQHRQAARSSGRKVLRLPHTTASYSMFYGEMRPNGQSMNAMPDPTLTSYDAAHIFPDQLTGVQAARRFPAHGMLGLLAGG